ncbi:ribulose-phosphate 3-epimerase [Bradyrhizobium sp. 162]|uniref:ribulose-phosphate 3-epimerase n=1 Tax=Bradyrhizobium sp. 162 TaxID=2782635 RepID=UPI001FF973D2|nr:ribulose-phosphate 3-epimerase [Bradyrhizobium sp. 162]MCK1635454.1 ribulose-phosphate 3-epimerase [Bradyrhizobium sp. 162]
MVDFSGTSKDHAASLISGNTHLIVAPALLAAPFLAIGDAARACSRAGADVLHIDIMDGRFAPSVTFGVSLINALKQQRDISIPLDVHLLIDDVDRYFEAYLAAGADILTIHFEASRNPYRTLERIRAARCQAGLAVLPATPVSAIQELLPLVDLLLIMTVHPGESRFIRSVVPKIELLRVLANQGERAFRIGVDGGVRPDTLPSMVAAGADWIVAGSAIFNDKEDISANICDLRDLATGTIQ